MANVALRPMGCAQMCGKKWLSQSMTKRGKISQGFLKRLRDDQSGNTLAIVAAAFIPMAGLIGGGVDMSRLYLVKTRLQQACDAGALAGRKGMGSGTWAYNSYAARTTAENMFGTNFETGAYGTSGLTKSFSENAGKVTGTASVTVPMTVMKIFSQADRTIAVTCDAEMRIPNTDVMFVLDVTGSMAWCPNGSTSCNGNSSSKIAGLKNAVKCFYEALAKLNSEADCGSVPSGGNGDTVQLRFGFVPYSSNVNVGKLLPNDWLANNWTYQSREANFNTPVYSSNTPTSNGPYWQTYGSSISQSDCLKYMNNQSFSGFTPTPTSSGGPAPTASVTVAFNSDGTATSGGSTGEWGWTGASDTSGSSRSCRRLRTDTTTTYYVSGYSFTDWTYQPVTFNVSGLKAGGSSWNNSVNLPIGVAGVNTAVTWDGCIEERQTVRNTDGDPTGEFTPIPAAAKDLDIDLIPSTGDATTQWGPLLANAVWGRYSAKSCGWGGCSYTESYNPVTTTEYQDFNNSYACPVESKKLQTWATATAFDTYVNTLSPTGSTYHDIGLVWGARLMSPTGLFASENAFTPNGGQIERNLIFMTDGDTSTGNMNLTYHGLPWYDRRQSSIASAPSNSLGDALVNERFSALCTAIKNKNITLWVISFGSGVSSTAQTRLSACATPGKFYNASDSATLIANFKQIADEISQLRLTN